MRFTRVTNLKEDRWKEVSRNTYPEISPAKMHSNIHILWSILENHLVVAGVGVEDSFGIDSAGFHATENRLSTEVGKQGIVELNVALKI